MSLSVTLAEPGAPLQKILATLYLFEEAGQHVFPLEPRVSMEAYNKPNFDKLDRIRIILVDTYSHMLSAATATRIKQFENEAACRPRTSATLTGGIVTLWRVKLRSTRA